MRVTLDGCEDDWDAEAEANVSADLSMGMNVEPSCCFVISVSWGSIIVTVKVVGGDETAARALVGGKLGGFPVTKIAAGSDLGGMESAYNKEMLAGLDAPVSMNSPEGEFAVGPPDLEPLGVMAIVGGETDDPEGWEKHWECCAFGPGAVIDSSDVDEYMTEITPYAKVFP